MAEVKVYFDHLYYDLFCFCFVSANPANTFMIHKVGPKQSEAMFVVEEG